MLYREATLRPRVRGERGVAGGGDGADDGQSEAMMAGYRVKYTLAPKLANDLVEAADEMMLSKTIARYGRVDLL